MKEFRFVRFQVGKLTYRLFYYPFLNLKVICMFVQSIATINLNPNNHEEINFISPSIRAS
jgi:hypothetical protein